MLESFVVLNALGGEFVDGFQDLRDDAGLASCGEFAFRFNRTEIPFGRKHKSACK